MRHWIDAAAASGMPIDPRLWLDAPPRSSYPACLAVKAAAEQGRDGAYLRRARAGLAYERRTLDNPDALIALARDVPGLDVERFKIDLSSNAITESFGADLERSRTVAPERRGEHARVAIPSIQIVGLRSEVWAYDSWDPDAWVAAAHEAGVPHSGEARPDPLTAIRRLGPLATPEVSAVCALAGPTAPARLWALAAEWKVRAERHASGETWSV
jgi:hypothetical protein